MACCTKTTLTGTAAGARRTKADAQWNKIPNRESHEPRADEPAAARARARPAATGVPLSGHPPRPAQWQPRSQRAWLTESSDDSGPDQALARCMDGPEGAAQEAAAGVRAGALDNAEQSKGSFVSRGVREGSAIDDARKWAMQRRSGVLKMVEERERQLRARRGETGWTSAEASSLRGRDRPSQIKDISSSDDDAELLTRLNEAESHLAASTRLTSAAAAAARAGADALPPRGDCKPPVTSAKTPPRAAQGAALPPAASDSEDSGMSAPSPRPQAQNAAGSSAKVPQGSMAVSGQQGGIAAAAAAAASPSRSQLVAQMLDWQEKSVCGFWRHKTHALEPEKTVGSRARDAGRAVVRHVGMGGKQREWHSKALSQLIRARKPAVAAAGGGGERESSSDSDFEIWAGGEELQRRGRGRGRGRQGERECGEKVERQGGQEGPRRGVGVEVPRGHGWRWKQGLGGEEGRRDEEARELRRAAVEGGAGLRQGELVVPPGAVSAGGGGSSASSAPPTPTQPYTARPRGWVGRSSGDGGKGDAADAKRRGLEGCLKTGAGRGAGGHGEDAGGAGAQVGMEEIIQERVAMVVRVLSLVVRD